MRPQEGDEVCTWDVLGKKLDYSSKDEIIDEINIFSAKLYLMLYDSSVVFKLSKHLNLKILLL